MIGLTLVASFYLGGFTSPLDFLWKTLALLLVTATLQSLFARLRIDQTVGLWWRMGVILVLLQLVVIIAGKALSPIIQPWFQSIFEVNDMTIGSMFGDIFKSLFKKPVTEKYPFVKKTPPKTCAAN